MQSKKQGGLQKVFVKFSLDLKGQWGPFFAKQEKKGKNKACMRRSCKFLLSLLLPERSQPTGLMWCLQTFS